MNSRFKIKGHDPRFGCATIEDRLNKAILKVIIKDYADKIFIAFVPASTGIVVYNTHIKKGSDFKFSLNWVVEQGLKKYQDFLNKIKV